VNKWTKSWKSYLELFSDFWCGEILNIYYKSQYPKSNSQLFNKLSVSFFKDSKTEAQTKCLNLQRVSLLLSSDKWVLSVATHDPGGAPAMSLPTISSRSPSFPSPPPLSLMKLIGVSPQSLSQTSKYLDWCFVVTVLINSSLTRLWRFLSSHHPPGSGPLPPSLVFSPWQLSTTS
jgi:hypothetical protein